MSYHKINKGLWGCSLIMLLSKTLIAEIRVSSCQTPEILSIFRGIQQNTPMNQKPHFICRFEPVWSSGITVASPVELSKD